jgi:hypothetical protein
MLTFEKSGEVITGYVRAQLINFLKWERPMETKVSSETIPKVVGEKVLFGDNEALADSRPAAIDDMLAEGQSGILS